MFIDDILKINVSSLQKFEDLFVSIQANLDRDKGFMRFENLKRTYVQYNSEGRDAVR